MIFGNKDIFYIIKVVSYIISIKFNKGDIHAKECFNFMHRELLPKYYC